MTRWLSLVIVAASLMASPVLAQQPAPTAPLPPGQTADPFPDADRRDRGRRPRQRSRVRVPAGHRRRRRADDAARRRARHAAVVRQRHARPALQRQLRRPDGHDVPRHQRPEVGRAACSRWAGSEAFRALRSTRSSVSPARVDSASSTPTPTPPTRRRRPTSRPAIRRARTTRCCSSGRPRRRARPTYDGGPPRELFRLRQPFANHNAGHLAFNPTAAPGSAEFGLLYVGVADGGSGGDPMRLAQNLGSAFGKIFRIDPLGGERAAGSTASRRATRSSRRPARCRRSMPTACAIRSASPGIRGTATCSSPTSARTSSRRSASSRPAPTSAGTIGRAASASSAVRRSALENRRGDPKVTYPIAEWGQLDPLLQPNSAATGVDRLPRQRRSRSSPTC